MLVELTFLKVGILVLGDTIRAAGLAIGGFPFSPDRSAVSGRWESERAMKRVFAGIAVCVVAGSSCSRQQRVLCLRAVGNANCRVRRNARAAAFLMGIPFPAAISRLAAAGGSAIPSPGP